MKNTWFQKLKSSLTKSSTVISEGITNIISSRRLDDETSSRTRGSSYKS